MITVLITGGTGFIGTHLVRHFLACEGVRPVVFARDEKKHYDLRNALDGDAARVEFFIGDVRDPERVKEAANKADIIIHAAAMKHVTHCEEQPGEAYRTNVVGAENVIRAVRASGRDPQTVFVSTDKAVAPVNVYGATKMLQEALFQRSGIRCVGVRYGNVLSSTGSVVPFFRSLAQRGRPLPVTDPDMTRFLITAEEAVSLIAHAMRPDVDTLVGTIFVPRPKSARVIDIADAFCRKYGVETNIVGARPGEKLHESLLSERDAGRSYVCNERVVGIRPVVSGFDGMDRRADSEIRAEDFISSGPLMSAQEAEMFLEENGQL